MAVAVSEDHQCHVIKWTEARASKCFLADELATDMECKTEHGEKVKVQRKLQLYIPKLNAAAKDSKRKQNNVLHTFDKCDPLGLGLMWDTCFLRLVDSATSHVIPLTRELLADALSGLHHSQAVEHDLFQDAAVMCDVPSQNEADDDNDEQLTIKSIVEEVDVGDDDDDNDDECDTGDEVSDQDDDDEDGEFEEDVEEL